MFASAKLVKGEKKEKELNGGDVRSWYMEHVIQLDLDRAYLPVRDILLPERERERNQREIAREKTDLELWKGQP